MRLVMDVDKQYKKLFMEVAKAANAKVQIDEQYLTEEEEATRLLKLMDAGNKEGRMTESEQSDFKSWLINR
ncbi:MAG: hypothetical protein H7Z72_17240 [Bacteroidetes bacterium]|nr:hypothetical protein [Fibrella sp.]